MRTSATIHWIFASFRLHIPEEPGQLAAVPKTVGETGANVLYTGHPARAADFLSG
jgi:hypothetical protein